MFSGSVRSLSVDIYSSLLLFIGLKFIFLSDVINTFIFSMVSISRKEAADSLYDSSLPANATAQLLLLRLKFIIKWSVVKISEETRSEIFPETKRDVRIRKRILNLMILVFIIKLKDRRESIVT